MTEIANLEPTTTGTENIYYQTLQDIGPLPTKWRFDFDESPVVAPVALAAAAGWGPVEDVDYPTIQFDRTPAHPSLWSRATDLPPQIIWAILSLAVIAIVACGWLLLP